MKAFNLLALFYVFVSVTLAVPVPPEGKRKAVHSPSPDVSPETSRPPSTEPPVDHPPLPGRSGHHTHDTESGPVTTIYYGDDRLPGHMRHVQRNQAEHPENLNPMELAHPNDKNRQHALRGIPTKPGKVRDEKLPNIFGNPHHNRTTTVEYRDPRESTGEGGLLSGARAAILAGGRGARGQVRANPGWLPLDPSQRRGHEAPATFRAHTFEEKKQLEHGVNKQPTSKVVPKPHDPEGYTPVTGSGMTLRARKGQEPPLPKPKPVTPARKKTKASTGETNLREGTPPGPPGHVFKSNSEGHPTHASHFGAPAPPSDSHQRQPPRPQNQAHYEKMQEEARISKAQSHGPSQVHHGPLTNLEKFNMAMGPGRAGNGHGRSAEAPARLG